MFEGGYRNDRNPRTEFCITESCNGCGLCKSIAPDFFYYIEYAYSYFIVRQPRSESEVELLRDTLSFCMLDAIRENEKYN